MLLLALLPAAALGGSRQDRALAKEIARLEKRIAFLEERIRLLEIEIARLSGSPAAPAELRPAPLDAWKMLAIGMPRQEVRLLLGPPDEIAPHSYLEIWNYSRSYGAPCSVTFDEEGRVESWTAP